jgi:hypothetical protein
MSSKIRSIPLIRIIPSNFLGKLQSDIKKKYMPDKEGVCLPTDVGSERDPSTTTDKRTLRLSS